MDDFARSRTDPSAPARVAIPVVPSDTTDLTDIPRELFIGGAGDVTLIGADAPAGAAGVTFKSVPAGTRLPVSPRRVLATGTTATSILALYAAGRSSATGALFHPYPTPPEVKAPFMAFIPTRASVLEGSKGRHTVSSTVYVTRNGIKGDLTVNLAYAGTATAGSDYIQGPASVVVPAGADKASFDLVVLGDKNPELDEAIVVVATLAAYPTVSAQKTIVVLNDDAAPLNTITFGGEPLMLLGDYILGNL